MLLTFAALNGDPYPRDQVTGEYRKAEHEDPIDWGPTLRAVADARSPLFGRVSDIYYLCHPAVQQSRERRTARSAWEVASATRAALDRHLDSDLHPRFHPVTWKTDRPPNDHAHLFEVVSRELRSIRGAHPAAQIVLQLSAGTSAMHAVLLVAGSVGIVEGPIRLLQAERWEGIRKRPEVPLVDVALELDTILRVARATAPAQPGADQAPSVSFDQARSPALRRALDEAQRAARVRFPILLRGERGVGKSTIASVIRAASPFRDPRKDAAWPSVACGQFTDADRLNAELCGAARGAYTGAAKDRWGLLHAANRDTLFLDEIHDLDPRSQRALIRVLEEGVYYRLGEATPRRSEFRLITGTNQPDEILRERLALDFLDRIRDIEVELPPLRDCREDLPWMWLETWIRVARQSGLRRECLADETPRIVKVLSAHPLPGNWRDLRRLAVRCAVAVDDSGEIGRRRLDEVLRSFSEDESPGALVLPGPTSESPRLGSKRDTTRLTELESALGPGFAELWELCRAGKAPELALRELLGDRHKARRASEFAERAFPENWKKFGTRPR